MENNSINNNWTIKIGDIEIPLTQEQINTILISGMISKNSFNRVSKNEEYYSIDSYTGEVSCFSESNIYGDNDRYDQANYCTNKDIMKQRALHETLNRHLWRFSCINGELENKWDSHNGHWTITKNHHSDISNIEKTFSPQYSIHFQNGGIYFSSKEIAQKAIDEILIPFIKKHPDFVW